MSKNNRLKASDIFKQTEYLFSKKVSFEEAFPEIEDLTVEVEERGKGVREWDRKRTYGKKYLGEYIDCSNSICYNGGFSIGSILREMVKKKKTTEEGSVSCQGYEGSPKGRIRYRSCINFFNYNISIKYKN